MHRGQAFITGAAAGLVLALPGCISAQRRIDANQAELYTQATAETQRVARQLEGAGPGPHDVRFFFSNAFINQNLQTLAGHRVILANDPDVDLRLQSVELATMGALPAVAIRATGTNGNLSADVTMNAVLVPTGRPNEFRVNVQSLAPAVRWRGVNLTRAPFAQRLIKIRALDVTEGLPTIRLPVEERISIGGPADTTTGRVRTSPAPSYLRFSTTVPATQWTGRIVNPRWFFLPNGVYLFADVR